MAETIVENRICMSCGVEARDNAMFCYNCGSAVSEKADQSEESTTSDVWFRGEIVDNSKTEESNDNSGELVINDQVEEVSDEEPLIENKSETEEVIQESKTEVLEQEIIEAKAIETETKEEEKPKININRKERLRSASSLRKKPKSLENKKVEVVWEEHENSPNLVFISVAIILVLLVFVIFLLAMYLQ